MARLGTQKIYQMITYKKVKERDQEKTRELSDYDANLPVMNEGKERRLGRKSQTADSSKKISTLLMSPCIR